MPLRQRKKPYKADLGSSYKGSFCTNAKIAMFMFEALYPCLHQISMASLGLARKPTTNNIAPPANLARTSFAQRQDVSVGR